jgi:SPP1 family predicted phage head-tail adaptor
VAQGDAYVIGPKKSTIGANANHRGMFQNPGPPIPSGTGWIQSWTDLPPAAFARITPATQASLEQIGAGTVIAQATHILTIPYRIGLTTKSRFVVDGRTINVLGIYDTDERHAELTLVGAEIVK